MTHKPIHKLVKLLLVPITLLLSFVPAHAADGSLDPTFGNGGIVTTDIGNSPDLVNALLVQPDGKLLAAGHSALHGLDYDFTLARYYSDGSLDTTFDGDGIATADFDNRNDLLWGAALQPDGKIVLVGNSQSANAELTQVNDAFALARFNSDGSLDPTFGSDGQLVIDFGNTPFNEYGTAVTIQPDHKILVVGFAYFEATNYDIVVLRLHEDGSFDTSFDGDGIAVTDVEGVTDLGFAVTTLSDGTTLVAASTTYGIAVLRYQADGSLDPSFGDEGKAILYLADLSYLGVAMALQPDGRIVVASTGWSANDIDFVLTRLNPDGSVDPGFGSNGILTTDFRGEHDNVEGLVIQPDGKIVTAGHGSDNSPSDIELARYNHDGSLDTDFGTGGKLITDLGGGEAASAIALQPDGKILVGGYSHPLTSLTAPEFLLARYESSGSFTIVEINIKPYSETNHVSPKSRGRIKVAILSTQGFNAVTMIDTRTLRFGQTGEENSLYLCRPRGTDVNGDGLRDLICLFSIRKANFSISDKAGILTAQTLDGRILKGEDLVRIGTGDD